MMAIGLLHAKGNGAESSPDIGQQGVLADEFRPLASANPANQFCLGSREVKCGTFGCCRCRVEMKGGIQLQVEQWTKIVNAGYTHHAADTRKRSRGQARIAADHARRQMAACGMT